MNFNEHSSLAGQHAFLSPSKYHWINYDTEKLADTYSNAQAARRGVELHAFAHQAINLGIKLPKASKTLNLYVNDAIGFRMTTEQCLYYSPNCYGHADTISFTNNLLRIHDLKTGLIPGSVHQLEVYAALFCLEYGVKPANIDMELRLYQFDTIEVFEPDIDSITHIISKIISFDNLIELINAEG